MAYLDEKELENNTLMQDENTTEQEIVVEDMEENKTTKSEKVDKKADKKHFKWLRGAFSELKKVTWPTFGRVIKETAVVLSVTAIFLVVIFGIDQLLNLLYNLLTKSMGA